MHIEVPFFSFFCLFLSNTTPYQLQDRTGRLALISHHARSFEIRVVHVYDHYDYVFSFFLSSLFFFKN